MSIQEPNPSKYHFGSAERPHTSEYLWSPILAQCRRFKARRVLDLGCGNGAFCHELVRAGFEVVGCDPSEDGIRFAKESVSAAVFMRIGVDDKPEALGEGDYDVVISTEVVEH
ncbi:MAG: class I SAM-dependent methyltransferase, partial [Limisphaerales bacterium]